MARIIEMLFNGPRGNSLTNAASRDGLTSVHAPPQASHPIQLFESGEIVIIVPPFPSKPWIKILLLP
jgi:hypothetical protein